MAVPIWSKFVYSYPRAQNLSILLSASTAEGPDRVYLWSRGEPGTPAALQGPSGRTTICGSPVGGPPPETCGCSSGSGGPTG